MRIIIDAFGGDNAPLEIIKGCRMAMDEMKDATGAGRGYGVAGGVSSAIEECIKKYYPGTEV